MKQEKLCPKISSILDFGKKASGKSVFFMLLFLNPLFNLLAQEVNIPEEFVSLFNGKDLSGWHISKTNHHGTLGNFFVENKAIIMKQYPYGQGGIILTDDSYGDFELYLEFKGHPGTNGGIFLRSNESGSGYQIEISGDGNPGTGNLIGEMLRTTTTAQASAITEVWKKDGWNSFRIRMQGEKPKIILWVNETKMWEVQAERNDLIADAIQGMIAFQLHWSATLLPVPGGRCCDYSWKPGAAHAFRNIAIKKL